MKKLTTIDDIPQYICTQLRNERIWRYVLISYFPLWCIASVILLLDYSILLDYSRSQRKSIVIFLMIPILIGVPLYIKDYLPYIRSRKWLQKKGCDIVQVVRSQKAVISLNPFAVVPYSQIAWIFLDPFYGEDSEPIYYVLNIYCKDGSVFKIENNSTGWYELLISELPEIMSGNGPEKLKLYLQTNPTACDKRNRVKTIWGIVLLFVMLSLGSLSLFVTKSIKPMGVVVLVALLIGGIVLIRQGKNKNK